VKVRSPITQVLENFFGTAWQRTAMLNRRFFDITHTNLHFGFELARAKRFSDVLKLQADYWQKLINAIQGEKFRNGLFEAGEPPSSPSQGKEAKAERNPAPATQKQASGPVLGTATQKPRQRSERTPKRRAATSLGETKRKAETRSKRKDQRLASDQARPGARKQGARQKPVSQSRRADIQFGRLDDNAVRFTKLEAWRLLGNTWRPIPVDEVLAEAVVLSEARFDQLFPQVPQLPPRAFLPDQDGD
jgi:hypothetical protein